MEKKMLRDYLENVRLLEIDIYTIDRSIEELRSSKQTPDTEPRTFYVPSEPKKPKRIRGKTYLGFATTYCLESDYPLIMPFLLPFCISDIREDKKKHDAIVAANQAERDSFDSRHAEWERHIAQIQIEQEKDERRIQQNIENAKYYNRNIDLQISELYTSRESTVHALNKLYDLGILYRKYRSFIPVSTFCEYLDSGRRTELEGMHGMYDLYETELASKLIIDELKTVNFNLGKISNQLGSISNQLVGIQRNQILTYEAVAEGNRIAYDIRSGTSELLQQAITNNTILRESTDTIRDIKTSSQLAAFHSATAARRMDAVARIAEYEFAVKHSPYSIP